MELVPVIQAGGLVQRAELLLRPMITSGGPQFEATRSFCELRDFSQVIAELSDDLADKNMLWGQAFCVEKGERSATWVFRQ